MNSGKNFSALAAEIVQFPICSKIVIVRDSGKITDTYDPPSAITVWTSCPQATFPVMGSNLSLRSKVMYQFAKLRLALL